MATILAAAVYVGVLLWLARMRPFLAFLFGFLLVGWTWKTINVIYMDLFGPVYAIELFREIGGTGATPRLVASYVLALLVLVFVFRRSRVLALLAQPRPPVDEASARLERISRLVFAGFAIFLVALFVEMAQSGVIPLLEGIERYVYTDEYGGPLNAALNKYLMLIGFFIGLFYWYPSIYGRNPDARFLLLLLVMYFYLFIAGHRYSAFYSSGTYFLVPGAAQALLRRYGEVDRISFAFTSPWLTRAVQLLAVCLVAGLIVTALYRSIFIVRNVAPGIAEFGIQQRMLVQQGELWVGSHDRIFRDGDVDPGRTFNRLFIDPVALPGRNTTIPYLMELEIGERAYDVIAMGSSYTGGYPEILFELLGRHFAWPGIALMAAITAVIFRALVTAMLQQRLLAVFLIMYVLWPFYLFHGAGMLTHLHNWKYGLKVAALVVWTLYEQMQRFHVAEPPTARSASVLSPGGQL